MGHTRLSGAPSIMGVITLSVRTVWSYQPPSALTLPPLPPFPQAWPTPPLPPPPLPSPLLASPFIHNTTLHSPIPLVFVGPILSHQTTQIWVILFPSFHSYVSLVSSFMKVLWKLNIRIKVIYWTCIGYYILLQSNVFFGKKQVQKVSHMDRYVSQ